MKFKNLGIISLVILFFLILGAVSATDDIVNYNLTADDSNEADDLNEQIDVQSGADNSNNDIGADEDEILSSENTDDLGADENDVLGGTKSYNDLFSLIHAGDTSPAEVTLSNDYEYKSSDNLVWHGGINIKKNVIIHGNGHYIDGKGVMAHFTITENAKLTIYDLNLLNGKRVDTESNQNINNYGGSIVVPSRNQLIASNCNFTNCVAIDGGAIYVTGGTVTLTNCIFTKNKATQGDGVGGAIGGGSKTLTVTNCKFIENSAKDIGGAIYIDSATVTIKGSTFSKNSVDKEDNAGGAFYFQACNSVTIENSNFDSNEVKNSVGSAVAIGGMNTPTVTIRNSNFTNHNSPTEAGAIALYNCSEFKLYDSTFRNNIAATNGGALWLYDVSASITNSNFIANTASSSDYGGGAIYKAGSGTFTITGSSFTNNKALNGHGGAIYTQTVLTVSQSTFTGNTAKKNAGAILVNGAYASISGSNFIDNQAQSAAGAVYSNNRLDVDSSTFNNNQAQAEGGALYSTGQLTVTGSAFDNNKVQNGNEGGAIYNTGSNNFKVQNSNFTNNKAEGTDSLGGAIYSASKSIANTVNVNGCIFKGNTAQSGAAVYLSTCPIVTIQGSTIQNNNASKFGSAIYSLNSGLTIKNSNIADNRAIVGTVVFIGSKKLTVNNVAFERNQVNNQGGAIYIHDASTLTVTDSRFNKNVAISYGGAIFGQNGAKITVETSSFTGNIGGFGGAIYVNASSLNVTDSNFTGGMAALGGAINSVASSTVNIVGSNFNNNNANVTDQASGGAIYSSQSSLSATGSTFTGNKANQDGGAIYATASNLNVEGSNFIGNNAVQYGGGLYCLNPPAFSITGTTFDNNRADKAGGAVFAYGQNMVMDHDTFNNNYAYYYGGAVYLYQGSKLTATYSDFTNNTVKGSGAAIYAKDSTLTVSNGVFDHNALAGINANTGQISQSAFIETDVSGGISESGNTHYKPSQFTIANIPDTTKGSAFTLLVTEANGYSGSVTVRIGSKSYTVSLTNGNGQKSVNDLGVGTYKAIIDFPQTGEYYSSHAESNEFHVRYSTSLSINTIPNALVGEGVNVKVTEANGYSGAVTVNIGTKSYSVTLTNGNGQITVTDLTVGSYKATISFQQTDLYTSARAESNQFTVKYGTSFTFVYILDSYVGEEIAVRVSEANGYSGTVTVKIGTNNYNMVMDKGMGAVSVTNLPLGTYTAVIDFAETSQYSSTHAESNEFGIIYKTSLNFTFIPDAVLGEAINIKVTEANGYTGAVTVKIDDKSYTVNLNSGNGQTTVTNLPIGAYVAVIDFEATPEYSVDYAQSNEFFVRYNTSFSIASIPDVLVGEGVNVRVTEANGYSGTVTVNIGTKSYSVTLTNGNGQITVTDLAVGSYKASIDFQQFEEYASNHAESNQFTVRYSTSFTIDSIQDAVLGEAVTVKVSEANGYTGAVPVKIGTKNCTVNLNNGNGQITVNGLSVRTYKAIIDFAETSQYSSAHAESNQFTVRYNTSFSIDSIQDALLGEDIIVKVSEVNGYTGAVTVKIGTKSYTVILNNGNGQITVNDLAVGTFNAVIDFAQTSDYVSAHTESNQFTVRYNTSFTIDSIPTVLAGEAVIVKISEANGYTGAVPVKIANSNYTVDLNNGNGQITVTDLAVGKYQVSIDFQQTEQYSSAHAESNRFTVKYPSFADLNTLISTAGSQPIELIHNYVFDAEYDALLANGISIDKDIVINGNGHTIDAKDLARIFNISNGAQVTIENITLINGNADEGGAIYASNDTTVNIVDSSFTNNAASAGAGAIYSEGTVNITGSSFKNNAAGNGVGVYAENGVITNSSFVGNDVSGNLNVSSDSTIVIDPSFKIANIPNFITGSSITIKVTESHKLNGTVVVTIGSQSFSIVLKNGVGSKVVTPKASTGTYTAKLKFTKSGKFSSAFAVSNKFTISAKKIVKTTPKLTAAKKTFKRKVKIKKYKATLKNSKRKAISKVKLTLKVKGKTYTAYTSKKGVATFKIKNLKKKGKFTAVIKFAGNKYYKKITKKVKITVK